MDSQTHFIALISILVLGLLSLSFLIKYIYTTNKRRKEVFFLAKEIVQSASTSQPILTEKAIDTLAAFQHYNTFSIPAELSEQLLKHQLIVKASKRCISSDDQSVKSFVIQYSITEKGRDLGFALGIFAPNALVISF